MRVRQSIRASTAAPTIFTPLSLDDGTFCDGAFFANNPAGVAYQEIKRIFPGVPVEAFVSLGTGCFVEEDVPPVGWNFIIGQLVTSATDTQRVHEVSCHAKPCKRRHPCF